MSALLSIGIKNREGVYENYTISIDDKTNEHGQNVSMYKEQTKEQREAKVKRIYVGNGRVIWTNGTIVKAEPKQQTGTNTATTDDPDFELPF